MGGGCVRRTALLRGPTTTVLVLLVSELVLELTEVGCRYGARVANALRPVASCVLTCTLHASFGGAVRPLPRAQTSRIIVVRLLGQVTQVRDLFVFTGEVIILDQFKVMGFALGEARRLVLCTAARPSVALVANQRLLALPFTLP